MDRPRFVIPASEAESMAEGSNLSVVQFLPSLVNSAKRLARPPISHYHVGAVGLGSSGRVFFGVNLEFPSLPLHHSVHAEQFLLTNLSINAEPRLHYLAVSSAPCGHCRQFLQEIRNAPNVNLLITSEPKSVSDQFQPLSNFLSHRFGPDDLLAKDVPLLLEPHHNGLTFLSETQFPSCNGFGDGYEELRHAALEAANKSHAPYSRCPSGVALMDGEGKVYKGSYTESAAYNPSLGPVQAAIVAYVTGGDGGGYDKIVAAVLVEQEGAVVKQEDTARLLLKAISPKCELKVFHCSSA
ncbi:hypothetical protein I3843_03G203900 [Carya illinoinensis]|nr:hypothetical protein I3760_03G208700 [Carya illinoinensis]KAG7988774.1 hypothetical protein I3843_03G203900 [Carya illinoinensis]